MNMCVPDSKPLLLVCLLWLAFAPSPAFAEERVRLGDGWRFHLGEVEGATRAEFDDRGWRTVTVPHDWAIEDLDVAKTLKLETLTPPPKEPRVISGPFDSWSPGGRSEAYTRGGTGLYRKSFKVPANWKNKRVLVQFDGVYMNADVWVNGHHLGRHPYGYTSFHHDLTPHLEAAGKSNVLVVRAQSLQPNSRWYAGAGLYRHVWLLAFDPVAIAPWGTSLTTPTVSRDWAEVAVMTELENHTGQRTDVAVETELFDPTGTSVSRASTLHRVGTELSYPSRHRHRLSLPRLWSPGDPALYTAVTTLRQGGRVVDRQKTRFGIRSIEFDEAKGFLLNGTPLLLKGANVHHDNGALGAAAYDRAERRKIELLKASGFNAVRLSHNPPSQALLDACDELGLLVIAEFFDYWDRPKSAKSHHDAFAATWEADVTSMIRRDRNHPSIILWSVGNEILEQHLDHGAKWAHRLSETTRALDPSRPVTASLCRIIGSNVDWPSREPFISALDVSGYNYMLEFYAESHKRDPFRILMSAESRGREIFDYWMAVEDHPAVVGDFVWTGIDYLGEPSIGWLGYKERNKYPWTLAYSGDLDICGFKRAGGLLPQRGMGR
ncbi:MAG: hypothetical protein KA712_01295 [Myxococcales bacterium]|nr:hypothetical protein [Myxococcales bacterium]